MVPCGQDEAASGRSHALAWVTGHEGEQSLGVRLYLPPASAKHGQQDLQRCRLPALLVAFVE